MHHQSISPSQRIIILMGMLLSFHFRSNHCANDFVPQSLEDATAVTVATPVSSHWTASLNVWKTRFEKECSAWRESPLLLNGVGENGVVVFKLGFGGEGLGNKFRVLSGNFWVSLLLKKSLVIQGVDGLDVRMFFKPNLYHWMPPPGMNFTTGNLPSLNCSDVDSHMSNKSALPLFITLHGCSNKGSGQIDIGEVLRQSRSVSAGFAQEVMKLWKTKHCFLQSMFMATDNVYSSLPEDYFVAHKRIGLHVRWGDSILSTVQTDSHFYDDRRVTKDKVMTCLKRMCKPRTSGVDPSRQKPVFIYMATDMPSLMHSVYMETYKSGAASEWSCVSNIRRLLHRKSYHTGRHTALASVDSIFLPAIADFVALAYSQIIMAPMHSSFSEQAAMFGLIKKTGCQSSFHVPLGTGW